MSPELVGPVEMQVDTAPSVYPEPLLMMDAFEAARAARDAGMAALVLVDQYSPTSDRALLVRKMAPGFCVFGSVTIGLNLDAISPRLSFSQAKYGVKGMSMPVTHSLHAVRAVTSARIPPHLGSPGLSEEDALTVLDRKRDLLASVKEVLAIMGDYDVGVTTGHMSPEQGIRLVHTTNERGLRRVVIDHPCDPFLDATLEQQGNFRAWGRP